MDDAHVLKSHMFTHSDPHLPKNVLKTSKAQSIYSFGSTLPHTAKVDMEDLGGVAPRRSARGSKAGAAGDVSCSGSVLPAGPPEMLTPLVRSSLTKQVWTFIPS